MPGPAPSTSTRRKVPSTWPVAEIFGPTVQGEGPAAGRLAHFVRFGGCDYRCSWCDTPYAVEPAAVRKLTRLNAPAIMDVLETQGLHRGEVVVLSGGNPALHHLDGLVLGIKGMGAEVHVETQGSVWRPWLAGADLVVVSPKPPSSGYGEQAEAQAPRFMAHAADAGAVVALKFVVGTAEDLAFAYRLRDLMDPRKKRPLYLSALTPPPPADLATALPDSYRRLCELVLAVPASRDHQPMVLPQLHAIAWGHARGV